MAAPLSITYIDYSGESSAVAVNIPNLDATNVEDYTDTTIGTPLGNFKAALDALTLMNETVIHVGAARIISPPTLPNDENAQREQKMLLKYVDTVTGKKYRFTVPGIDRTLVAQQGTDVVDFGNNVLVIALVAAFEAGMVSELGNAVSVYGASLIGVNN